MKKLVLAILVVGLFITSGIEPIRATTALYNASARIVNASGFVINGTASATTASYNFTAQIVSSTGTVLNPGTASGVSASPQMTLRIIDANGFVQDSIGTGGGTPTFRAASSVANNTVVSKPTGTVDADYVMCVVNHASAQAITVPDAWAHLTPQGSMSGGGTSDIFGHCANGDGASYTFAGGTTQSICCAAYSNTHCNIDGTPQSTTAATTTPQVPAITTTLTNDMVVGLMDVGGTGFTAPATETTRVTQAFVGGTNYGCWIGDLLQATAATVPADVGSFSSANSYLGWRVGIRQ